MQPIEWRPCPGFPDYEVSNTGQVKRSAIGIRKRVLGVLLAPEINKDGHHRYTMFINGKRGRKFSHQLVCLAWHGEAPTDQHIVCHKNDNKDENTPTNLYWGTRKQNGSDSVVNGRSVRGEKVNTAKLNESQVIEIRERSFGGATNIELAGEFGIPDSAISQIVRGKNWKHVGGPIQIGSRRGQNRSRTREAA